MTPVTLTGWLHASLRLTARAPWLWLLYLAINAVLLAGTHLSLALGIFVNVVQLLIGVGLAGFVDTKHRALPFPALKSAILRSLPLAILAASAIVLVWLVLRIAVSLYHNDTDEILAFFYQAQWLPARYAEMTFRQLTGWLYASSISILVFVLLMLTSFASWFSYPLMLFDNYPWSQAKIMGDEAVTVYAAPFYQLMLLIFILVIVMARILPWLTPVMYTWVAMLMYVSYQDVFRTL
ncbi:MAG: hypothetical protein RQ715_06775 [Methylococcales bacterium]|nr:hypothetical protein [Methylococcales bacterium]